MSAARKELQEALCCYSADTLIYIDTVRGFCERSSKWMLGRKSELNMLRNIKERANKISLNMKHVMKSENKGAATWEYVKSKFTQVTADSRRAELQKELAVALWNILARLEELDRFLDAVEKLAVTSLHVFTEEHQVLHLPKGISPEQVQVVIAAARLICPLLLEFKRDASVFFLPRLQNVEMLSYQLEKYIQTTQKICDKLEKSSFGDFSLKTNKGTVVDLDEDLSEDDIQRMLRHIKQLDEIRKNQNFRMVFLFQEESGSDFIDKFSERQPRMLQFLNDLEKCAVQLDKVNKGAKISSVAGSSVGAVGGVLSIVGLALFPVTAGVSLVLTMTGAGLGIASGVNSGVTAATEIGVNRKHKKKAKKTFQSFMEDVQILQDCLDEATRRETDQVWGGVGKVLVKTATVGKGIDALVDGASALKMLKSEEVIASSGTVVAEEDEALRNVNAVKGPLALFKSARAGFIAFITFFLGMDIFFICKDSISLYRGSEAEVSQFFRARSALWRSEIDSWQKICDSLREGLPASENNKVILETPFYPEKKMKKEKETETELPSGEVDKKTDKAEKTALCN